MTGKESILIWVPTDFKLAVRNIAARTGRSMSAITRDALFSDLVLLDEYLAITDPENVQPPAPVVLARRAEAKAKAVLVGGDPDAGMCGACGKPMEKVDATILGKTCFIRWQCKCGFRHLQRTPIG